MDELIAAYKELGYRNVKPVSTPKGNGYYMVNSNGSGSVYLPPNASNASAVVGMYPGMGSDWHNPQSGTGNYSDYINETILRGKAPEGTILVFADRYGGPTAATVPSVVNTALKNGVNVTNVGVMTFSGSGESGMYAAGIVSSEHSNIDVRVINCDSYTHSYVQSVMTHGSLDKKEVTNLGARHYNGVSENMKGNVLVVNYIPDKHVSYEKYDEMVDDINYMATHGHNTILITGKSEVHGDYRVSILNGNGIEWLAGRGEIDTSSFVKMQKYDPATKTWVDCDLNGKDYKVKVLSPEELYTELKNNGGDLRAFASTYGTQEGETTLASNLSFVSNSMENIRSKITEHTDVAYNRESDHEASILGAMYGATNYYGTVTNLLYGNISSETEAIYGIANAIFQMDECSSQIASASLSDGISNMFATTNPSVAEQLEQLKNASAELLKTTKNSLMSNERYSDLKNILGTKAEAGSVGKLSISSLDSAVNSIIPALDDEVNKATALNASVADFMSGIGASNILQGGVWDDVNLNMSNVQNLLNANVKAASFIQDSVKTAMGIIKDYIDNAAASINAVGGTEYGGLATLGELDDSKLPELSAALTEMQNKIDEADAKVRQLEAARHMVADGYTDKNGNFVQTGEHQEPSEAEIQPYRDQLAKYKEIKQVLDTYKGVLEGFAPVVQAAQEIINSAVDQVTSMYANPVQDTDGNLTFNADFNLDLSPYSDYIDVSKDYKGLINDYYNKLNEQPTPETENENPDGDDPAGSGNPDNYPGSGGGSDTGGPSQDTPSTPKTTEPKTETPTQAPQQQTPVTPERPTQPQIKEEPKTEPIIIENRTEPEIDGGSHVTPSGKTNTQLLSTENKPEPNINTTSDAIIEDVDQTIEDASPNEYIEAPIEKAPIVNIDTLNKEVEVQPENKTLKTMGIASGIGMALGAASLGAHSIIKKKDEESEKEDYGYNK